MYLVLTVSQVAATFKYSQYTLVSTLPCASIEAGASIEAPFDPPANYWNIELF